MQRRNVHVIGGDVATGGASAVSAASVAALLLLKSRPAQERLVALAALVARAVSGAGVTMLEEGRTQTVVWSARFVSDIDDIQYGLERLSSSRRAWRNRSQDPSRPFECWSEQLTAQLNHALTNGAVIDQAVRIVVSHAGAGADEAFDRLRAMSQAQHTKILEVSRRLIDKAAQRARGRRVERMGATGNGCTRPTDREANTPDTEPRPMGSRSHGGEQLGRHRRRLAGETSPTTPYRGSHHRDAAVDDPACVTVHLGSQPMTRPHDDQERATMTKTIVITGASDGIGAAGAVRLHRDGHEVVIVGRSPDKTQTITQTAGRLL